MTHPCTLVKKHVSALRRLSNDGSRLQACYIVVQISSSSVAVVCLVNDKSSSLHDTLFMQLPDSSWRLLHIMLCVRKQTLVSWASELTSTAE